MLILVIDFIFIVLAFGSSLACGMQAPSEPPSNSVDPVVQVSQVSTPDPSPDMPSVRANCKGIIWSGTADGKSVVWTADDVFLISKGRKQALFRPSAVLMHRAGVETTLSNLKYIGGYKGIKKNPAVKTSVGVEIKSVVNTTVTFEIETLSFLEGHPGLHNTWWLTLDLSKAGNKIEAFAAIDVQNFDVSGMADLRALFPKDDLYNAIVESAKIRAAFDSDTEQKYAKILNQWLDLKEGNPYQGDRIPVGDQGLSLLAYSFKHFVFDRIENEKIAVRIALVNLAASDTYSNEYIEIFLPLEGPLGNQIYSASRNENGFLARDRNKILKGCTTNIEFSTPISTKGRKRD